MDGRGNLLFKEDYTETTSEKTFLKYFILEFKEQEQTGSGEEESERLYAVPFEEVDMFRRHTRSYIKKIGVLKFILALPRRQASKKFASYIRIQFLWEIWKDQQIYPSKKLFSLLIKQIQNPLQLLYSVNIHQTLHLESWLMLITPHGDKECHSTWLLHCMIYLSTQKEYYQNLIMERVFSC